MLDMPQVDVNVNTDTGPSFQDDTNEVMRQRPTIASFNRLRLAIRDPRLNRAHLRVLESVMGRLNASTGTAWPGRAAVAEAAGLNPARAQNCLYDLRKWGYLLWERLARPELHKRPLIHYTLPLLSRPDAEIEAAVHEAATEKADRKKCTAGRVPGGPGSSPSTYPAGRVVATETTRPAGLWTTRPAVFESARQAGCSNLERGEPVEGEPVSAVPSERGAGAPMVDMDELVTAFPNASDEKLRSLKEFGVALQSATDEQLRDLLQRIANAMPEGSAIAIPVDLADFRDEEAEADAKLQCIEAILERKDLSAEQKCVAWDALLKSDTASGVPAAGEQGLQGGTSGEVRSPTTQAAPAAAESKAAGRYPWEQERHERHEAAARRKQAQADAWYRAHCENATIATA
jgi:hypothetical protein